MPVFTLTDVGRDIRLDEFAVNSVMLPGISDRKWSVHKRTLHGGLRDGVDVVEVCNGDLSFTVLPTRGMGLWRGDYRGMSLGWQAPVLGPVHPKFVNLADRDGLGWLQGFDEWLCRCGLASVGPPGQDGPVRLNLHGRIANSPAHRVEVEIVSDPPRIIVRGEVEEGGLFYPRLRLATEYSTAIGSSTLNVHDRVTNAGGTPAEMQVLYHVNFGPPLLSAGSVLHVPVRELWPMTTHAADGLPGWTTFGPPRAGFDEQVYCLYPAADNGRTLAVLRNADRRLAVALHWLVAELPCFTVWKNTAAVADGYVAGLEPATCFPRFRAHEREAGRVQTLAPGESWSAEWHMEFADGAAGAQTMIAEVARLQGSVESQMHAEPLA